MSQLIELSGQHPVNHRNLRTNEEEEWLGIMTCRNICSENDWLYRGQRTFGSHDTYMAMDYGAMT